MRKFGNRLVYCPAALAIIVAGLPTPATAAEFKFASIAQGREILLGEDEWYAGLGTAEIAIRLGSETPDKTAEDLKAYYNDKLLTWSEEEILSLRKVVDSQRSGLDVYSDLLPEIVWFVKVSDKVEGALPHTRKNAIFFSASESNAGVHLFLHELFHILSREQAKEQQSRRDTLYRIIGFEPCDLEETPWMETRRLSNPDVPSGGYYLSLESLPSGAVIPWHHTAYDVFDPEVHGGFGGHFGFGLVPVVVQDGTCKPLQSDKGIPVILQPHEVPGFLDAIGHNTGYIIHPEEVLADNFVFLMLGYDDLPNPEIVESLRGWLDSK